MDIGKPVRIHNIPEPKPRRRWEEEERRFARPRITKTTSPEQPIPVPDWPIRKKVEVETE